MEGRYGTANTLSTQQGWIHYGTCSVEIEAGKLEAEISIITTVSTHEGECSVKYIQGWSNMACVCVCVYDNMLQNNVIKS